MRVIFKHCTVMRQRQFDNVCFFMSHTFGLKDAFVFAVEALFDAFQDIKLLLFRSYQITDF